MGKIIIDSVDKRMTAPLVEYLINIAIKYMVLFLRAHCN